MRSFFGSILLILVLAALGATIYYHWSTNSHLEFELRNPDEPEKPPRSSTWRSGLPPSRRPRRQKPLLPLPPCGRSSGSRRGDTGSHGIVRAPLSTP